MSAIKREPTEVIGETLVFGDNGLPDGFLNEKISLAKGKHRQDKKWQRWDTTVGDLVTRLQRHQETNEKDGFCFTQGSLVGPQRKATAVDALEIIGLDMDTGAPIEEVREEIISRGWFAFIYTTHSHNSTQSKVKKDELARKLKLDPEDDDDITDEAVRTFFSLYRNYDKRITQSMKVVERTAKTPEGIFVLVDHIPIPKYRIIFVLDHPYDMGVGSQKRNIDRWKGKYRGLSRMLGAHFDNSCIDPSRLFYLPSHKPGAVYHTELILGDAVNLDDIQEAKAGATVASNPFIEAGLDPDDEGIADDGKSNDPCENRWVDKFWSKHHDNFDVVNFLRIYGEVRQDVDDNKISVKCPFDDAHSDAGNEADVAFFGWNAGTMLEHAGMACKHDSCSMWRPKHFLDKIVTDFGLTEKQLFDEDFIIQYDGDEEEEEEQDEEPATADDKPKSKKTTADDTPPWEDIEDDKLSGIMKDAAKVRKGDSEGCRDILDDLLKLGLDSAQVNMTLSVLIKSSGFSIADVKRMWNEARAEREKERAAEEIDRVQVHIQDAFEDQISNSIKGLKAYNKKNPRLFKLDGEGLCRVVKTEGVRLGDAKRELLDRNALFKELNEAIYFYETKSGGGFVNRSTPTDVLNHFLGLEQSAMPLSTLSRLVKHPIFSATGKMHHKNGYDSNTCAYLDLDFTPLHVPPSPTDKELDSALSLIFDDLLVDFPFKDRGDPEGIASKANMLAMMLQPFVRDIIGAANTPMFLIDKPVPGAGSGKLADMLGYILTGERVQTSTYKRDEAEVEKEIISKLRTSSDGVMFFDNVNYRVDSQTLASAITSGKFSGRLLGGNTIFTAPIRHIWLMSGNNVSFANEMLRRLVPITLVPDEADPASRTKFKHTDLDGWALDHRPELIQALCTIIAAWVDDGMPDWQPGLRSKAKVMGSFERWSLVLGGILDSVGIEGFLENQEGFKVGVSFDEEVETDFLARVHEDVGVDIPFTSGDLHKRLWDDDDGYDIDVPGNHRNEMQAKRNLTALVQRVKLRKFDMPEQVDDKDVTMWIEPTTNARTGALRFVLKMKEK